MSGSEPLGAKERAYWVFVVGGLGVVLGALGGILVQVQGVFVASAVGVFVAILGVEVSYQRPGLVRRVLDRLEPDEGSTGKGE